jgi:hypothetical protein
MALIAVSASGYLTQGLPDWLWKKWPAATASAAPAPTYKQHQDRQVRMELPSGWRWLAQKPDGSEADAAYFPMSRFQGQNVLKGPISVRVDGIPNGKGLKADELLAAMTKGIDAKPAAIKPMTDLPKGMAGIHYPTMQGERRSEHYVFVKSGGHLSYVLAIGSGDERFSDAMASHVARTFQVSLQ